MKTREFFGGCDQAGLAPRANALQSSVNRRVTACRDRKVMLALTLRQFGLLRSRQAVTLRFTLDCSAFVLGLAPQSTRACNLALALGALLLAAPDLAAPVLAAPDAPLVAPYRKNIKLDGNFKDWRGIPFVRVTPQTGTFDSEAKSTTNPNDLSFRFAVCHDDGALYVAVEVKDNAVWADSSAPGSFEAPAWDDDAIEVFIDGNHNRAPDARALDGSELKWGGEFSLVANGAAMSNYSGFPRTFGQPNFWQGATNWKKLKQGQPGVICYEFRLCWNVMGGKVRPGDTIGFTLAAQDDDDGGGREHSFYWKASSPHGWQNEAAWGEVYLKPKGRS